ncbi:DUF429 domain-containing protein [Gimesia chilikensis]|uniref:DUF429 domain-containing protein n=1 Tax=Gimesia chilikensis TaxID=2605989 RepID=A0A517PYN0_9PLAN|nr:DUF429 domain-containing protein [Gimesia chilikensis]QDT24432.1 hypothetical protein HG66A1_62640 [Gimesia chilikensis]
MKVYGLDFTSAPVISSPSRVSDKLLMVAECELTGSVLLVEKFIPLTGDANAPFGKLEEFFAKQNEQWICGVDFPFGMPLGAIDYFGWCKNKEPANWEQYVKHIHKSHDTADEFMVEVEQWMKFRLSGEAVRVFLFRYADRIASFGGSTASSPMKINKQCNPPVGRMFFEGSKRLLDTSISILPVRPTDDLRILIEAYPRLVADKFINGGKYKDAKKSDDKLKITNNRKEVVEGLEKENPYGITIRFICDKDREKCLNDGKGDHLDSVLCAIQAGWSANQTTHDGRSSYGIPEFSLNCLGQQVALEGWILDPLTLAAVQCDSR